MAAHRLVLAACSPFLRSLINDLSTNEAANINEPLLLVLPDVKVGTIAGTGI
jgi:BTB/POZ domain